MVKKFVWWIPMLSLALALLPLPYEYYAFLRVLVCGVCIYLANADAQTRRSRWSWVFGGVAVLYNPFISIHLDREFWFVINLTTIWLLAAHMWSATRVQAES